MVLFPSSIWLVRPLIVFWESAASSTPCPAADFNDETSNSRSFLAERAAASWSSTVFLSVFSVSISLSFSATACCALASALSTSAIAFARSSEVALAAAFAADSSASKRLLAEFAAARSAVSCCWALSCSIWLSWSLLSSSVAALFCSVTSSMSARSLESCFSAVSTPCWAPCFSADSCDSSAEHEDFRDAIVAVSSSFSSCSLLVDSCSFLLSSSIVEIVVVSFSISSLLLVSCSLSLPATPSPWSSCCCSSSRCFASCCAASVLVMSSSSIFLRVS
mmetsp:Transcript_46654/g.116226  ORF Transcript_46654/g.116226 Transcript_46654/m.116226 type:complete len:278 (-) Transcript_46654:1224-2057(-)